jgi:6-phosphogluconolactonase/glucosamine-6-phosphate isomerase/deaminase
MVLSLFHKAMISIQAASLFQDTSVLEEREREREQWVAVPWVEKFHTHRITLTPPVFNAAKRVLFVVGGSDRDKAAAAVLEGPFQPTGIQLKSLIQIKEM